MKRRTLSVVVAAAALPLIATSAPSAAARPVPGPNKAVPQGRVATHQVDSSKDGVPSPLVVKGYKVVSSDPFTDVAGVQTGGTMNCPTNFKVVGGGAVISGTGLSENLNGSLPLGSTAWRAYVNNAGSTDGTFRVYAICVKKTPNLSVQSGTAVLNPAGAQTRATATCPTGSVPFGGGGDSGSSAVTANMNSTLPSTRGWDVDMNNASPADTNAFALVVCSKRPAGYRQVSTTTPTTVGPGTQASASVVCPANTVVFGGGGFSSSGSVLADLNSSLPSGNGWIAYENNNSSTGNSLTAWAVCGRVA